MRVGGPQRDGAHLNAILNGDRGHGCRPILRAAQADDAERVVQGSCAERCADNACGLTRRSTTAGFLTSKSAGAWEPGCCVRHVRGGVNDHGVGWKGRSRSRCRRVARRVRYLGCCSRYDGRACAFAVGGVDVWASPSRDGSCTGLLEGL
jgi:hypothetical protein